MINILFSIMTQHFSFVAIDISRKEQRNFPVEIYRSTEGNIELNVKLENDTVWLTQSQMAELFAVDRTSVTRHIRNIYKSQELYEKSTCAKNAQVSSLSVHDFREECLPLHAE